MPRLGADLLLGHDRLVRERAAAAPVLGRDRGAEQAELAGFEPDLPVDVLLLAPAVLVGRALLVEEAAGELPERLDVVVAPGGTGCGNDLTSRR